jgi:hypothetical protein
VSVERELARFSGYGLGLKFQGLSDL